MQGSLRRPGCASSTEAQSAPVGKKRTIFWLARNAWPFEMRRNVSTGASVEVKVSGTLNEEISEEVRARPVKGGPPPSSAESDRKVMLMPRKDAISELREILIKRRDALRKAL